MSGLKWTTDDEARYVSDKCPHIWYWRRRRNQSHGYWECVVCGALSERVGLDRDGRAAKGPPPATKRR